MYINKDFPYMYYMGEYRLLREVTTVIGCIKECWHVQTPVHGFSFHEVWVTLYKYSNRDSAISKLYELRIDDVRDSGGVIEYIVEDI